MNNSPEYVAVRRNDLRYALTALNYRITDNKSYGLNEDAVTGDDMAAYHRLIDAYETEDKSDE